MWDWLAENIATVIICICIALLVAAIIRYLYKQKKKGNSCGCSCASCPMAGKCSSLYGLHNENKQGNNRTDGLE